MVVDDVCDHGDAVEMAEVDERLQLIDLAREVGQRQLGHALLVQEPIHAREIDWKVGCTHGVVHLGRKQVGAIVAKAVFSLIFLHR